MMKTKVTISVAAFVSVFLSDNISAKIIGYHRFRQGLHSRLLERSTKLSDELGAAKTSAFYAIAPFIGTFLSLIIFNDIPGINYFVALAIMLVGAKLCA